MCHGVLLAHVHGRRFAAPHVYLYRRSLCEHEGIARLFILALSMPCISMSDSLSLSSRAKALLLLAGRCYTCSLSYRRTAHSTLWVSAPSPLLSSLPLSLLLCSLSRAPDSTSRDWTLATEALTSVRHCCLHCKRRHLLPTHCTMCFYSLVRHKSSLFPLC